MTTNTDFTGYFFQREESGRIWHGGYRCQSCNHAFSYEIPLSEGFSWAKREVLRGMETHRCR